MLWVTGLGTILLTLALALGSANPSLPPRLLWRQTSPSGLPIVDYALRDNAHTTTFARLPFPAKLPVTIQASADFGGQIAIWGFWLTVDDVPHHFLLHPDGYVSTQDDTPPNWYQFIHIRPALNHLALALTPSGRATLRINHEIAWTNDFPPDAIMNGGIVFDSITPPQWANIQLNGG